MLAWKLKINNEWVNMPTPSTYSVKETDLDKDSFRSVVSGNVHRTRIAPSWSKLGLKYNFLTHEQIKNLLPKLRPEEITGQFYQPTFGGEYEEYKVYIAEKEYELIQGNKGWTLSFNIIQAKKSAKQ